MNCHFCNNPITIIMEAARTFRLCLSCAKNNELDSVQHFMDGYLFTFKSKTKSDEMWRIATDTKKNSTRIDKGVHSYKYDICGNPEYNYHCILTIPGKPFTPTNCKQRLKICLTFS